MFFNIVLRNVTKRYEFHELVKVFFHEDEYEIHALEEKIQGTYITPEELEERVKNLDHVLSFTLSGDTKEEKNALKREMYECFSEITGFYPPWGILTGVRPVKMAGTLENPKETLTKEYYLSEEKADEVIGIYKYQQKMLPIARKDSIGLYIGIPFCPTRCLYCSFTSNQPKGDDMERYLDALVQEIEYCGKRMQEKNIYPESIYIGGGTPTTLDETLLEKLLVTIEKNIDMSRLDEFTLEAGRPDTITFQKLSIMKSHGVNRISINPQSMNHRTLERIGRSHTPTNFIEAYQMAMDVGFESINCDLIAGLPGETEQDFKDSVEILMSLNADNITVHTLAVKKASRLIEVDKEYHHKMAHTVENMMKIGKNLLLSHGYQPYYLYRQKAMSGSLENVGYCKDDLYSVYNVRIMDESQSILALGAGGISKIYFPEENRLERVPNVSNFEIYISRIDEMIERKEKNFFNLWR